VLAQILSASAQGRVALGTRGGEPNEPADRARGPRQAHLDGFDLYANVWVPPNDRIRLEHLCRYLLRPPLAQDRLRLRADRRVTITLKSGLARWDDTPRVRAPRVPRETGRADAPACDQSAALPRPARATRALAPTG